MSTRSATIIRQTTYWGEQAETEELLRFYRHYDGYPEGHGLDMARKMDNTMPVTISVYSVGWGDSYSSILKRESIFSGTAYEYIEKFRKEQ